MLHIRSTARSQLSHALPFNISTNCLTSRLQLTRCAYSSTSSASAPALNRCLMHSKSRAHPVMQLQSTHTRAISTQTMRQQNQTQYQRMENFASTNDFTAAAATVAANSGSATVPYPFTSATSYSSFLTHIASRCGHHFKSPAIVSSLFFHTSLHRYLCFLGSGLMRYYVSYYAYHEFPHYDEGYLTRLKDFCHHGINVHDIMTSQEMGVDMREAVECIRQEQRRWRKQNGETLTDDGYANEKTKTPANASSMPSSTSELPSFGSPESASTFISAESALAQFVELLSRSAASDSPSALFHPHTVFPVDMLTPLLAALYLDGGWQACDAFANRTIRVQLLQLQSLLHHELPDRELGTINWKSKLQPVVQKRYGVTPLYQVRRLSPQRVAIRVVVPVIAGASEIHREGHRRDKSEEHIEIEELASDEIDASHPTPITSASSPTHPPISVPAALAHLHTAVHVDLAREPIFFAEFIGTKKIAEQRAAREAYERIREEKWKEKTMGTDPDQVSENMLRQEKDEMTLTPDTLRSELHRIASLVIPPHPSQTSPTTRFKSPTAKKRATLKERLESVAAMLVSPAASHIATPKQLLWEQVPHLHSHSQNEKENEQQNSNSSEIDPTDPFELVKNEMEMIQTGKSPSLRSSTLTSVQWISSDYDLLIQCMHALGCWSSFPPLWPLLSEIDFVLTLVTTSRLIDGFSYAGTLPLVIQTLRKVRTQGKWHVDRAMVYQLILASTRANPLLGWQQTEKLLEELKNISGVSNSGNIKQSATSQSQSLSSSSSSRPVALAPNDRMHYNAALWCCLNGYSTLLAAQRIDPESSSLISVNSVLKWADSIRSDMRAKLGCDVNLALTSEEQLRHTLLSKKSKSKRGESNALDQDEHSYNLSLALCGILDAYANQLDSAWSCLHQLERRCGVHMLTDRTATHPNEEENQHLMIQGFERKRVLQYEDRAKPMIQAFVKALGN